MIPTVSPFLTALGRMTSAADIFEGVEKERKGAVPASRPKDLRKWRLSMWCLRLRFEVRILGDKACQTRPFFSKRFPTARTAIRVFSSGMRVSPLCQQLFERFDSRLDRQVVFFQPFLQTSVHETHHCGRQSNMN